MWLQILLIILVVFFVLLYYSQSGRVKYYIKKIPGPPTYPIIGNLLLFSHVPYDKLWLLTRKLSDDYYPIYALSFPDTSVINIRHPDDVEILLSSTHHIDKSRLYEYLHPWFGTGLLTSTGSKWHQRRKILTPAFHFNVLKKYMEIISESGERLIDNLKTEGESVQDLVPLITSYTLNIICGAAMGTSLIEKKELHGKYRNAIHEMGDVLTYRIVRPWLRSNRIFNLTAKGRKQKKALKVLHGFSKDIINERKEYHKRTNHKFLNDDIENDKLREDGIDNEVFSIQKRRLAMLDLLIAAYKKNQIDDVGIQEEVDTFMFEGHDTSAMGICFVLLLLAEHKEAQAQVRMEITEALKTSRGKMDISMINQLIYLDRCIKEALRLYPSVPFISRQMSSDLHLKKYVAPKGTMVHIHVFDLHRDPNFWPDPLKFNPDRFASENIADRHPFSYIPFSAGSRNCIGQKFAMLELKSITAHILRDFYLECVDFAHEVPIVADLVLRPGRPIHMKFIPIAEK